MDRHIFTRIVNRFRHGHYNGSPVRHDQMLRMLEDYIRDRNRTPYMTWIEAKFAGVKFCTIAWRFVNPTHVIALARFFARMHNCSNYEFVRRLISRRKIDVLVFMFKCGYHFTASDDAHMADVCDLHVTKAMWNAGYQLSEEHLADACHQGNLPLIKFLYETVGIMFEEDTAAWALDLFREPVSNPDNHHEVMRYREYRRPYELRRLV
jgi:hypothetical protein